MLDTHPKDIVMVEHTELSRVTFAHSPHPLPRGELRTWGSHPRYHWDPHSSPTGEHPEHGALYTAGGLLTCVAEALAGTCIIDTCSDMPLLQVWEAIRPLRLFDFTSAWALRNGASVSLDSALRLTYRAWTHATRIQPSDVDGLRARPTVTGGEMTVLFSPACNSLPALLRDTVPLADATFYVLLKALAPGIGYEIV